MWPPGRCPFAAPLPPGVRRHRAVFDSRNPDLVLLARPVAIYREAAVVANRLESVGRERRRRPVGVPSRAVELEPHAIGGAWPPRSTRSVNGADASDRAR